MANEPMNPFEEEIKAITQEFQLDPFAYTRAVQQEEMKGWRQMLTENYNKRQEENKKRVRNAQILGIGKALGDMIGAIWGGVASSRNNAPAVVPAPQASKTAEQVEKLIQEGVVNAQDYDKMMLNLSMQEKKDKIALAKAYDELGIKQAQDALDHKQRLEVIAAQGQKQQAIETLRGTIRAAAAAQNAKDKKSLETLKGQIRIQLKRLGGVGNLDWFTYESLQELFPGEVEFTTTTTSPDKYGQPQTKTVSGTRKMPQGAAQAKMTAQENERFAKATGLSKEYLPYFSALRKLRDKLGISEQQLGENVKKSIKTGKTIDQILKYHGIE